jgi:hypothetical protein
MGLPPLRYPQISTFVESDRGETRYASTGIFGLGNATITNANAPIRCDATEVALIDEVVMTAPPQTTTSNISCFLAINGRTVGELGAESSAAAHECKFHFIGGAATVRQTQRIVLQPRGNMVVSPSSTLWFKGNSSATINVHVKYRQKRLTKAIADGDIKSNGGIPLVASTNSVTGSGLDTATAKAIIANGGSSGIEILGFYFTGHNYAATIDDHRLGFWDGVNGTFATNGNTVFRAWAQGINQVFAPRIIVDDTRGCIQTSVGNGLYVQATAGLAGNPTPTSDYVVMYRRINALESDFSGTIGTTPTMRKKWWLNKEGAGGAAVDYFFADPGLTDETGKQMVKIHGHAFSCTTNNSALGLIGLQWGDGLSESISDSTFVSGDGTAATVSTSGARTGLNTRLKLNLKPGFLAFNAAITNRTQLAWGTFGASSDTGRRSSAIAS